MADLSKKQNTSAAPGKGAGSGAGALRRTEAAEAEKRTLTREERAKRRRRRLDNRLSTTTMFFFILFWAVISIFLLFFPRSTVSNIEKRQLAKWPSFSISSYFSGDYTSGITSFYDDTVPFRDFFKNVNNNIKSLFGLKTGGTAQIIGAVQKVDDTPDAGNDGGESVVAASSASVEAVSTETTRNNDGQSKSATDEKKEQADGELNNGFLIIDYKGHWRGLPLFPGGTGEDFVDNVNEFKKQVGDDVAVYAMPDPLASAYYLPSNYSDYSADQTEFINNIFKNLDDDIIKVNIIDTLSQHQDEDIYLRTDHHWTALGAYYAAQDFAEAAGVPYPALDSDAYVKAENDGYVGSLYGYTQSANLLNDPETFVYYTPTTDYQADFYTTSFGYNYTGKLMIETDTANSYLKFTGTDDQIVKVTTSAGTGRKMAIIKDSYGNPEVPFLTSSFDQIFVIDMRYFDLNLVDFVQQMGITDVLFSANVDSVAGANASNIATLITQNKGNQITDEAPETALTRAVEKTDSKKG